MAYLGQRFWRGAVVGAGTKTRATALANAFKPAHVTALRDS